VYSLTVSKNDFWQAKLNYLYERNGKNKKYKDSSNELQRYPTCFLWVKNAIWSTLPKIGSIFGNSQGKSRLTNNYYRKAHATTLDKFTSVGESIY